MVFLLEILIVDDNEQNCEILEDILSTWGYKTHKTFNGIDAVNMAIQRKPDLILLDVMLPGMNGFEVCDKLKTQTNTKDIPIIMLTVLNEVEDRIHGLKVGADDFMSKPINYKELEHRIGCLIKNKQTLNDMELDFDIVKSFLEIMRLKDENTYHHTMKVKSYCEKLARFFYLKKEQYRNLLLGAYLHDIGKIISLSPKEHIFFGEEIIKHLKFHRKMNKFIRNHHERFDGRGYPDGLLEQHMSTELQILITVDRFVSLLDELGDEETTLVELEKETKKGLLSYNILNALKQIIEDEKFIKDHKLFVPKS